MVEHPWMRTPAIAKMLGLMLGALGIIVGGLQIKEDYLRKIFVTIGTITFLCLHFFLPFF